MGHDKTDKINVQKSLLKSIFTTMLETNIEIMKFQITMTDKEEERKGLKKYISETKKAIKVIFEVRHYEILISLYNTFLNGKETYFMALCKTINDKKTISRWDKSEKGFQEFLKLEAEAKAKSKEEYEKRLKDREMIIKAKQEGKKVEMVLENGKLQPRIVEEKPN